MPIQRGLVSPAIIASTVVMVTCGIAWGALGALSLAVAVPALCFRYLCSLLATLTVCSVVVHMSAHIVRVIRETRQPEAPTVCGYVDGYTAGLDAAPVSPAVTRLVPRGAKSD